MTVNEDTAFIVMVSAVVLLIFAIVIIGAFVYPIIDKYVDKTVSEVCAPKMILSNGTKICK